MTLILSLINQRHVIQVSDRRLSNVLNGQFVGIADDEANKAVVAYNLATFAYTGLATVGAERSDLWLWDRLQEVRPYSHSRALRHISDAATLAFDKMNLDPHMRRHAFVAVGWGRRTEQDRLVPFTATVSNALDEAGGRWRHTASREFVASLPRSLAPPMPWHLAWHGQNLHQSDVKQLVAEVKSCMRRRFPKPGQLVRVLAEGIRRVARDNHFVGESLMAVVLPRCEAGTAEGLVLPTNSIAPDDKGFAMYLPANLDTPSWFAPHFVGSQSAIGDFEFHFAEGEPRWCDPRY